MYQVEENTLIGSLKVSSGGSGGGNKTSVIQSWDTMPTNPAIGDRATNVNDTGSDYLYHEYSTTEHIVGKWIDGKTIYEKTFVVNETLTGGTLYTIPNSIISNLSEIIEMKGSAYRGSDRWQGVPMAKEGTYPKVFYPEYIGDMGVKITLSNIEDSFTKTYITIQYTKADE